MAAVGISDRSLLAKDFENGEDNGIQKLKKKDSQGANDNSGIELDNFGTEDRSATGQSTEGGRTGVTEDIKHEKIKEKLRNHFRDPYTKVCREQKWYNKCPKKLVILILKFCFVTAQLCIFGYDRADFANYLIRSNIALKHLLLKGWDTSLETMPYPPSSGTYAVYQIDELLEHINFTVNAVNNIQATALGSFFVNNAVSPNNTIKICLEYFEKGIYSNNRTGHIHVNLDLTLKKECQWINADWKSTFDQSVEDLIQSTNGNLVRLLSVTLSFSIDSIFVHKEKQKGKVQCFRIFGIVTFDNYGINGQIPVTLKTRIEEKRCYGEDVKHGDSRELFLSISVLLLCSLSIFFSGTTFGHSLILAQETCNHYKECEECKKCKTKPETDKIKENLSCGGTMEIIKLSDFMRIISDLFNLSGSIMKIYLNYKMLSSSSDNFDVCGILIGIGCLLTWFGVLHYLTYDPDFNLLFSVMWKSASKVLRFLLCVGMLYLGFTLCGWVVLGPYHIKFADPSSSFQCLMSLLNGDEVYVTYTAIDGEKAIAWWFNAIFVTVFVVVFTLIALNIFIAIFNSAYEAIRNKEDKTEMSALLDKDLHTIDKDTCDAHCGSCCC